MPTEHFKSEEAYKKYRAYVHTHGIKTHAKKVCIQGHCHTVKHSKSKGSKGARKRVTKSAE